MLCSCSCAYYCAFADLGNVHFPKNVVCRADAENVYVSHSCCAIADQRNSDVSTHSRVVHSDCVIADLRNFPMSAHSLVAHSNYSTAELRYLMTSAQSSNSDVAIVDRANSDYQIACSWHSGFCQPPHSWTFFVSAPEIVAQPLAGSQVVSFSGTAFRGHFSHSYHPICVKTSYS